MPLNRPSLQALRDRITADFELHSSGNPHLRGSLEFALANALVGVSHTLHGAIEFNARQLFDISAEDEFILRRAAPFGLTLIAAVAATGTATITGTDTTVIPAGTELQAPDTQIYTTDTLATITGGTATLAITSSASGAVGNQLAGVKLALTTPIAGAASEATIDVGGLTGGADQESIERFKQRFAERKKAPPRGGSNDDYIAWAKQAAVDVTRVWVYRHEDIIRATVWGAVLVYIVADELPSPIPDAGLLATVQTYIDQTHIRPIGAKDVVVAAPIAKPLNITFSALTPNTTVVQQAIEAELADMLKREAEPGGTILLSHIREAISIAAGEDDYTIDLSANFTTLATEIAVPGTLTWPGA